LVKPYPKKPRIVKTVRTARKIIKESGIGKLPINPEDLFELYGWGLYSCTEIEALLNCEDPFHIYKDNVDAKTFYANQKYLTIYDDKRMCGRIRWTLAHEIGHIVLGHLTDFQGTNFKAEDYRILEREANIFAAELLAPLAVLKHLGVYKITEIASLCGISKQAARYRVIDIFLRGDQKLYCEADAYIRKQFGLFLRKEKARKLLRNMKEMVRNVVILKN